jgi:hypothetical protein
VFGEKIRHVTLSEYGYNKPIVLSDVCYSSSNVENGRLLRRFKEHLSLTKSFFLPLPIKPYLTYPLHSFHSDLFFVGNISETPFI